MWALAGDAHLRQHPCQFLRRPAELGRSEIPLHCYHISNTIGVMKRHEDALAKTENLRHQLSISTDGLQLLELDKRTNGRR